MAKAIVCIDRTYTISPEVYITYSVSFVDGANVVSLSSQYKVNLSINQASNLAAWRNLVVAQGANLGIVLIDTDVIVFGGPV